jgi:release factor glutamine methyltransferase
VFAETEAGLLREAARSAAQLDQLVARRTAGEPLELVLGWAEFAGRRLKVVPGVFVPRRRTELLATAAAGLVRDVAVDLCTGVGAIASVLATTVPASRVIASDIDPIAVACARANTADLGVEVYQGDLFEPLSRDLRGHVDVVVANVPYVPSAAVASMPVEAREHEPRAALDGGPDGLDVLRRVAAEAPLWLREGGRLLAEIAAGQAAAAVAALTAAGLAEVTTIPDGEGDPQVVVGALARLGAAAADPRP